LIALALVTLATPASALPISENTIRRECRAAKGTYVTEVKGGTRFSACYYRDIYRDEYADFYVNGDYYSTRP
jgi:hypothetical protein